MACVRLVSLRPLGHKHAPVAALGRTPLRTGPTHARHAVLEHLHWSRHPLVRGAVLASMGSAQERPRAWRVSLALGQTVRRRQHVSAAPQGHFQKRPALPKTLRARNAPTGPTRHKLGPALIWHVRGAQQESFQAQAPATVHRANPTRTAPRTLGHALDVRRTLTLQQGLR